MSFRKRAELISNGARTNAYTDFHSTVFYAFLPCTTSGESSRLLLQMLQVMEDVVRAPTQFNQARIDKERQAILSEAILINTLKHRKDKAAVEWMDSETRLPLRMPIGDLEMIKRYSVDDLKQYHKTHYIPSNATLYIVGDFDLNAAKSQIQDIFGTLKDTRDEEMISFYKTMYQNTVKERRSSLPPAKHDWHAPGPKIKIWENEQIKNVTFELMTKAPLPSVQTFRNYYNELVSKLVYRLVGYHFDIVSRDCGLYQGVIANSNHCINEGCKTNIIEIGTFLDKWQEALYFVITQLKTMVHGGFPQSMLNLAIESYTSLLNKEIESMQSQNFVNHMIEANACHHAIMRPIDKLLITREMLDNLHVDDINQKGYEIFYWLRGDNFDGLHLFSSSPPIQQHPESKLDYENLANTLYKACAYDASNATLSTMDQEIEVPEFLYDPEEQAKLFSNPCGFVKEPIQKPSLSLDPSSTPEGDLAEIVTRYTSAFKEYKEMMHKIEYIKPADDRIVEGNSDIEQKLIKSSGATEKDKLLGKYSAVLMESKAPISSTIDPSKSLYKTKMQNANLELLQMSNGIAINIQHVPQLHHQGIVATIPLDFALDDKDKLLEQKHKVLLGAISLMEGGQIGSKHRKQVELFCSRHLIDVNIEATDDFFTIQMAYPREGLGRNNVDSALEILYHLLQHHEIEPDAYARAIDKIAKDIGDYSHDFTMCGVGDVVNYLSNGILSRHKINLEVLKTISMESVQSYLNDLFNHSKIEVSICTDEPIERVKKQVSKYLGSVNLPIVPNQEPLRYKLITDLQTSNNTEEISNPLDDAIITIEDSEDRALVILAGHAPNASGILPNGTHMATLLENRLAQRFEHKKHGSAALDILSKARRELWLHPAFPMAMAMLLEHLLNSRFFSVIRNTKDLAYETNVKVTPMQVQFAGFFTVLVHAKRENAPVILSECKKILSDLSKGTNPPSMDLVNYSKGAVLNELKKESKDGLLRAQRLVGIQSKQQPLKNYLAVAEFDLGAQLKI
ncbi:bifunctional Metalloenzyme [Babesia duncani]|uniref:Bifunctional Metalloenzyme n=1 Tax=Babesia duncani TaxID=323732 RepID=A0AAD9PP34_9APIC|nr:bifunctional Metalloenzyme [Babesia duncani]